MKQDTHLPEEMGIGSLVYPNDDAISRRPDFEYEFRYMAQKVVDCYPTGIPLDKYPNSSHIVEIEIYGQGRRYYSSALRKVL